MIDFKSVEAIMSIVGMIFGAVALAVTWLTRGSKDNAVKIKDLEAASDEQNERIRLLESRLTNLPTKDEFHTLDIKLTNVNGNMEALSAQLAAVDYLAKSMDTHLRENGGKS